MSSTAGSGLRKRKRERILQESNKNESPEIFKLAKDGRQENTDFYYYVIKQIIGVGLACLIGYSYSNYLRLLHENNLWFSQIQEIEREISFRTENGLYYSYFKHLALQDNLYQAIASLTEEDRTECWRSINVIQRFNIYQEIFLAIAYKVFNFKKAAYELINFYIDSVFMLHGIYISLLFTIAWFLGGNLISPIVCTFFFIFNRENVTRVEYSVPLRESFAIPFIYMQILLTCFNLRSLPKSGYKSNISIGLIFLSTLIFCLFWQFSQFVVMLQAFTILALYLLDLINLKTYRNICIAYCAALLTASLMLFVNQMIIASFALSFTMISLCFVHMEENFQLRKRLCNKRHLSLDILFSIAFGIMILTASFVLAISVKRTLNLHDDNHIYKFVSNKLSPQPVSRDFETMLYLCHSGFENITWNVIEKLTSKAFLLPIYFLAFFYYSGLSIVFWYSKKKRSDSNIEFNHKIEISYLTILSSLFCLLACSTIRMQYLWTPSMCILASVLIADESIYKEIIDKKWLQTTARYFISIILICIICMNNWKTFTSELNDLREFHDPETVELMHWINLNTNSNHAFAGSMQLMASVKCCTGRRLTNHPHFEDATLRNATRQIYEIYGRQNPLTVYEILKRYKADYVIIENSICYASVKPNFCSLKEIIDMDLSQNSIRNQKRFCEVLHYSNDDKLFHLAFENKKFRVYKI